MIIEVILFDSKYVCCRHGQQRMMGTPEMARGAGLGRGRERLLALARSVLLLTDTYLC